jgi:hypothetical protein
MGGGGLDDTERQTERKLEGLGRSHMSDDFAFNHIDNQFGHIGGVIGDTLNVLGNKRQADSPRDRLGIFHHKRE